MKNNTKPYYVDEQYRTNSKSLTPGGWDVMVVYKSGETKIYDNVKNTEAYAKAVLSNPIVKSVKVLGETKKN